MGTEEIERYLLDRNGGKSRSEAAKVFGGLCLHEGYAKQVEKMVAAAVNRSKALFPGRGDDSAFGYCWCERKDGLWVKNTENAESAASRIE